MTQTQTVQVGYGKANLSSTLATYACMKVTAPFARVSAASSGPKVGSAMVTAVGSHQINGVLINNQVQHPNGTVILLTASWKRGGSPIRDGALFIRLRFGAPHYNVLAKVPLGAENICGDSFVIFSGTGDIMNADELLERGIEVQRSYVSRFMDEEELGECFILNRLAPESIKRPELVTIATPDGTKLVEVSQAPTRRMVFRRTK